jgi:membrane glycosyltransferase
MATSSDHVQACAADADRLGARRGLFALLVLGSSLALFGLMGVVIFGPAGWDALGVCMWALYGLTLPWTTLGFWNAVVGFVLMVFTQHPERMVAAHGESAGSDAPIMSQTALCVCTRNEDVVRLERNLSWMLEDLARSGQAQWFHLYLLSDSDRPEVLASEQALASELMYRFSQSVQVTYRHRVAAQGFKAGNLRDFLDRFGSQHEHMIVLDADSLMSAQAMLRLVRIMQAHPEIGILQTLVTALPSDSAFARVFQYGMRLGMRSWTMGSAWWQGDCGPYWGHNAILRIRPFSEHCRLPLIAGGPPLGGHVLSHDQLEAVLMRRCGHEVRVLPQEGESWEENPPDLLEFIRRDLRWCQGNMQYLRLLDMAGLRPVSRWQLWIAIAMYLSGPGWMGFALLAIVRHGPMDMDWGYVALVVSLFMGFAPKFATLVAVLWQGPSRQAFGGTGRIVLGAVVETSFSMLIAPVIALSVTLFMLGLPLGQKITWQAHQRDSLGVPWRLALARLWPHTLVGLGFAAAVQTWAPQTLAAASPMYLGLIFAPLVAVWSASPRVGAWARELGLCQLPEEHPRLGQGRFPFARTVTDKP